MDVLQDFQEKLTFLSIFQHQNAAVKHGVPLQVFMRYELQTQTQLNQSIQVSDVTKRIAV